MASGAAMREWQGIMDGAVRELNSDMTPVASRQLVGVMIFVYVSAKLRRGVRNVDVQACRTGLGGIAGNKGGVSVRLTLGYSSIPPPHTCVFRSLLPPSNLLSSRMHPADISHPAVPTTGQSVARRQASGRTG